MTRTEEPPRHHVGPELYDLMYDDVRGDLPYWVERAHGVRGPVLEVACGSGRVLAPLLAAGVDADGLDADPDMLAGAAARLGAAATPGRLQRADMRDFTLPRRYALVFIAFNSFLHNLTREDQLATLGACRAQLAPGGAFELCVFVPDPRKLLEYDGQERSAFENHRDGATLRAWDANLADPVAQTTRVRRRIELQRDGAPPEPGAMEFTLRWIWPREMELLLQLAGFARWAVHARTGLRQDFAPKPRLEPGDFMVWTAWNA